MPATFPSWVERVDGEVDFPVATAVQEELLRAGGPSVYVGVVRRAGVSFGVGVAEDAAYLRRATQEGLAVHRRSSGGTGIVHLPGDLVWGLVLPRDDPRVGRGFVREYARLGAGLSELLRARGAAASWASAPGLWEDYCPLGRLGSVLLLDGRIVGAAAQHATSRALLHHGLLSATVDRGMVTRLFAVPRPEWSERLGGLCDRGIEVAPAEAAHAIVSGLKPR